jgi:hypothetical protein
VEVFNASKEANTFPLTVVSAVVLVALLTVPSASEGLKYRPLYAFDASRDGGGLYGSLILDAKGNLYGETWGGGFYGFGTVFELCRFPPGSNGKWTYTVLHRFTGYDGAGPNANLILDSKNNLYGTTTTAGAGGYGVAFELTP